MKVLIALLIKDLVPVLIVYPTNAKYRTNTSSPILRGRSIMNMDEYIQNDIYCLLPTFDYVFLDKLLMYHFETLRCSP